jgi:hypothetical protein
MIQKYSGEEKFLFSVLPQALNLSAWTCIGWPYPKANINPIMAPKPVLRYGLQVSPQVLPALRETRLSPYPITAPIARPIKTFKVIGVLVPL